MHRLHRSPFAACLVAAASLFAAACLVAASAASCVARAPTVVEIVRAQGFVRCASVERPGLATLDETGGWIGLEVDLCRAVAAAVLGPAGHFTYHAYDAANSFEGARDGRDEVAFLTPTEMVDQDLTDRLKPGPPVFVEGHDLLVARDSPVRAAADLARTPVCLLIATPAHDSLDAWFGTRGIPLMRYPFREEDEMYDAYTVQRCKAVVGETTALAKARLSGGINHLRSRLLPGHLATVPIYAATSPADAQWSAIVASVIAAVRAAEIPDEDRRVATLRGLLIQGRGLGLSANWQAVMLARTGDYGAMFERHLGAASPLGLERGLN